MFEVKKEDSREVNYRRLTASIKGVLDDENDVTAALANVSAFINTYTDSINWVGFYILKNDVLVLGPFQGLPACAKIGMGKGVCGEAASQRQTLVVDDVHAFPGHIACDGASNSEIVLPLYSGGEVFGVLDIDSPVFGRFGPLEKECFEGIARLVSRFLDRTDLVKA